MIVIKGKMPKNCHECKNGWCQEWERVRDMTKEKSKDCPIVGEIPDKHGRLIDADAIGNWLREQSALKLPGPIIASRLARI